MYIHLFVLLEFFFLHVYTQQTNDRPERRKKKESFLFFNCTWMRLHHQVEGVLLYPHPSFIRAADVIDHLLDRERGGGGVKDLPLTKRKLVLQASIG